MRAAPTGGHLTNAPFGAVALTRALAESLAQTSWSDDDRLRLVREFVRTAQDDTDASEEVDRLVERDPGSTGAPRWDAVVAGAAEWVVVRLGAGDVPAWTDRADRFLDEWWFAESTGFGRAGALANAPAAFRRRGVLIDPLGLASDGVVP